MIIAGPNTGKILVAEQDPLTKYPTIAIVSLEQMRARFANKALRFNSKTYNTFEWWLAHPQRRDVSGIVFDPGASVDEAYYNLWRGFAVEPRQGDCSPFVQHIWEVIAEWG